VGRRAAVGGGSGSVVAGARKGGREEGDDDRVRWLRRREERRSAAAAAERPPARRSRLGPRRRRDSPDHRHRGVLPSPTPPACRSGQRQPTFRLSEALVVPAGQARRRGGEGGAHRRAAEGRGGGDSRGGLGRSDWREQRRRGAGQRHTGHRGRLLGWRCEGRGCQEARQPPLEGRWRQRVAASAQWRVTAGHGSCEEDVEGGRLLRSRRRAVRRPPTAPTAGGGVRR